MTLRSLESIPTTPSMMANQLAHRALATQVNCLAHTPYRPLTRKRVREILTPLWAKAPELATKVKDHPDYRAALWLAARPPKRRRRKVVAA
jgi:hypothetical protein